VETSDGEVILDNPIPDEQAFHLIERCSAIEASFCCISEDDAIARLLHPEAERGFKLHHGLFSEKPISHISELKAYLIVVVSEDLHPLVELTQKQLPDIEAGPIVRRYQAGLEVSFFQNNRTNKAAALRSIVNYYDLDLSKTLAIGDSIINDGLMIEAAGCGVAMKNAHEEILKKADFITEKDNNQDGVGDFLRTLFQI
jgi:hydroxymethylpyrimidine pyrophosphatase-like HAD family hydrolase